MPRKTKLKAASGVSSVKISAVHDRRASALPKGAMVAPVEVDDPYEKGAKILAFRSIRDDPLNRLHAHGDIDGLQHEAGRCWQDAYEKAEIGGARAIDTTREYVDGGTFPEPISDAKNKAYDRLWQARRGLIDALGLDEGRFAEALIRDVLGDRLFLNEAAQRRDLSTDWQRRRLADKFKKYLDILAVVYGCQNRARTATKSG